MKIKSAKHNREEVLEVAEPCHHDKGECWRPCPQCGRVYGCMALRRHHLSTHQDPARAGAGDEGRGGPK